MARQALNDGRQRPIPTVVVDENSHPVDWQRLASTSSVLVLAVIATGAFLYFARELLIPIVTAFAVGVMLSPVARKLETWRVPRVLAAALIVLCTALLVALVAVLIVSPVTDLAGKLPQIGAKLQSFNFILEFLHRAERSLGMNPDASAPAVPIPSLDWAPTAIGYVSAPTTGFLYFLVVLLLFISWWPDLRRGLVMTFASRDSRLTVLKIVNEIEQGLAAYLLTVACINLAVGAAAGLICWLTGLSYPLGFAALAATLNFIPIIGPVIMIGVLALFGAATGDSLGWGLMPAGLFMLVIFVEGQFITPSIIGRRLEINSLAVLLSLLFWGWLWGPMGAFLSSPLLIVGLILVAHLRPDATP
jgi:predicted PurR-regulated permease PerM